MKNNIFKLSVTYAGCFLGAGFVSGQELGQFFSSFGEKGKIGLIIALTLFYLFGVILLRLIQMTGINEADKLIVLWNNDSLRKLFGFLEVFILFGFYVAMVAGVSSIGEEMLQLNPIITGLVFCGVIVLLSLTGVRGMMVVFSLIVPVLVLFSIVISVMIISAHAGYPITFTQTGTHSAMLPNWWIAGISYVSFNVLGSIGILAPLGTEMKNKRIVHWGVLLGSIILMVMAFSILSSMSFVEGSAEKDLPMLFVASQMGNIWWTRVFALLLFGAMFGTSLSCFVGIHFFLNRKVAIVSKNPRWAALIIGAMAWVASLIGFENVVSYVYPVFGYIGIIAFVGIIFHFIMAKKENRIKENKRNI